MRPFTYDVESVELTSEEAAGYAHLVGLLCHKDAQHTLTEVLARVNRPQTLSVQEYIQRQARRMWRTEVRLLDTEPDPGEVVRMNECVATAWEVVRLSRREARPRELSRWRASVDTGTGRG